MGEIEIKTVKNADNTDIDQLKTLYIDAGWWDEKIDGADPGLVQKIIDGSFCFMAATLNGRIVGMGRSISDGVSDAYIQDVAVLNEFRGRGFGILIMDEIVKFLKSRNIGWIGLISESRSVSFYDKYGFSRMENCVPFIYT